MKRKLYYTILFKIFVIWGLLTLATYLPDHFREFFGDTRTNNTSGWDQGWDWGKRHVLYAIFSSLSSLLLIIDAVIICFQVAELPDDTDLEKQKERVLKIQELAKLAEEERDARQKLDWYKR